MKYISTFIITAALTGCGRHRDGTSVWAEGLFILPAILLIASGIFAFSGYRIWKSGSKQMRPGVGLVQSNDNLPWYRIPYFRYAIVFLAVAIVVIFWVNWEKG